MFTTVFATFDESIPYTEIITVVELVTCIIFLVEYVLRLWTVEFLYPEKKKWRATLKFAGSFYGIVDLLTFLPVFLPFFFPSGMVAFPTGIISAGFVEEYTKIRMMSLHSEQRELKFVTSIIPEDHSWNHKLIKDVIIPPQLLLVKIIRRGETILPNGMTEILQGDTLVIGAKNYIGQSDMHLKELKVKEEHDWVSKKIRDIDISRQELIVMIRRKNKTLIPNGSTMLREDDTLIIYSKNREN